MQNGWTQLRRGILDHLTSGKMPVLYLSPYTILQLQASPDSGIVFTNARILEVTYNFNSRFIRRALERLEETSYIKRFSTPGSSKPYPVLINKFLVTVGASSGMYLNAIDTVDPEHPIYETGELGARKGRARGELGASSGKPQYRKENRELRIENLKPGAHKTRQLSTPILDLEPQTKNPPQNLTRGQIDYGRARILIPQAIAIMVRAKSGDSQMTGADVKEELKTWAARAGVEYDAESIRRALDVAEGRTKAL